MRRNQSVAALAHEVFVVHAATGGKTEAYGRELVKQKQPLLTFDRTENRALLKFGLDGEEQTLEQIGQKYGVTRERVRQRLVKILPRLARQLSPKLKLPIPKPDDEVHTSSETAAAPNASQPLAE
jgi:hypothetical protein